MDERISQPNEPAQGPATIIIATVDKAPSPPQAQALSSSFSEDDEEGAQEFEFPPLVSSRDSPAGTAARPADELFADGRIRPFYYYYYPVFGHGLIGGAAAQPGAVEVPPRVKGQLGRLFLEESRARKRDSAGGDDDGMELEGAPPESYCLWTPGTSSSSSSSPRPPPRKQRSSSTGSSMARWRRISDLVVGRSHSFGKEKFVFFPAPPQPNDKKASSASTKHHDDRTKTTSPASGGVPGGTPRRTFLPYREELVGFFANVNGISRSHHHPF